MSFTLKGFGFLLVYLNTTFPKDSQHGGDKHHSQKHAQTLLTDCQPRSQTQRHLPCIPSWELSSWKSGQTEIRKQNQQLHKAIPRVTTLPLAKCVLTFKLHSTIKRCL